MGCCLRWRQLNDLEKWRGGTDPVRYMIYLAEAMWAAGRSSSRMLSNIEEEEDISGSTDV